HLFVRTEHAPRARANVVNLDAPALDPDVRPRRVALDDEAGAEHLDPRRACPHDPAPRTARPDIEAGGAVSERGGEARARALLDVQRGLRRERDRRSVVEGERARALIARPGAGERP